jgi:hypothetical protein
MACPQALYYFRPALRGRACPFYVAISEEQQNSSELDDLPLAHDRSPPPRITQPDCSHLLCDQIVCNSPQLKQTQGP